MSVGLIIGMGEVGKALCDVLHPRHAIATYNAENSDHYETVGEVLGDAKVDVMHICFPYSDSFEQDVCLYKSAVDPRYTVIHSTVPVGTSKALNCHHSPVRGTHPNLAECMKTFVTYLAPPDSFLSAYFLEAGMHVYASKDTNHTEAGKLWSLAAYAWNILLEKEIYKYCKEHDLIFEAVYQHFTHTYNMSYAKMGIHNVQRPILEHIEGPIGGHCTMSAVEKLADDSELANIILELGNRL